MQMAHVGVHIDTVEMKECARKEKLKYVQLMFKKLILLAHCNGCLVPLNLLKIFCSVCVTLTFALSL